MIEKLHDHIVEELKTTARTDMVFIITAVALNLITLAINSAVAGSSDSFQTVLIFMIFVALIITVNIVSVIGLSKGRQTRTRLLTGLVEMYEDTGVAKYYDKSILSNYNARYILFTIAVAVTGLTSLLIPMIILTN